MVEIFLCPRCGKKQERIPYACTCGYQETIDYNYYADQKTRLFNIYKFSKLIFDKKIDWAQSEYDAYNHDGKIVIRDIFDKRAVAYVDIDVPNVRPEEVVTVLDEGALAFERDVSSLIINVHKLEFYSLEESSVHMVFLGDKVKDVTQFWQPNILRYIEVSKNNPCFTAENNVLFNKDMTKLLYYCGQKPEREYTIPASVKEVGRDAFDLRIDAEDSLKVIHCSKKVKFEPSRFSAGCVPYYPEGIKIVHDQD